MPSKLNPGNMPQILFSCDRKTRAYPSQKNTYGLLPGAEEDGGTCPGCTRKEGGCYYVPPGRKTPTCYVCPLLKAYKGIKGTLQHNTNVVRAWPDWSNLADILDNAFARFEKSMDKRAARTGENVHSLLYFRLHWSGDVFDATYAKALAEAMIRHPRITFWTYTRTFDRGVVPILKKAGNLILYLSLDEVNWKDGFKCFFQNDMWRDPRFKVAFMGKDRAVLRQHLDEICRTNGKALGLRASSRRTAFIQWLWNQSISKCPVDAGEMPLEGGCMKCRQCIRAGHPVLFFKC